MHKSLHLPHAQSMQELPTLLKITIPMHVKLVSILEEVKMSCAPAQLL